MPQSSPVSLAKPSWAPVPTCCWSGHPLVQGKLLDSPVWVCPAKPCLDRQMAWAMASTEKGQSQKLLYLPLPRQVEALEAVKSQQWRRLLYGGAAGGGKSKFLRFLAYYLCLTYPNFTVLLLRRTWPELEETHIRDSLLEAPRLGAHVKISERLVEFPATQSRLKFGHCQDEKDMGEFLSREYDLILFDELVTFLEKMYLLISSRARTTRPDWNPMVVAGTNPGGAGASWVKEIFIDKHRNLAEHPHYKPQDHRFIQALLDDNPYVNPSYVDFLADLPSELREAYRFGNWDIFPGQYFKEFRQATHCAHLSVPSDIPRLGAMDWGYLRPGVFLWAVVCPDGRLYIEQEFVFTETLAHDVGEMVTLMTHLNGWTLLRSVGDPAMGIRDSQTGEDTFETLAKAGLYVQPGNNSRVIGWQRLRHWLKPLPDGKPAMLINPDGCPYLVRTLPQLMSDLHKPEDVDTSGEDHAADALRYLAMDRPHPMTLKDSPIVIPGTAGELLHQARFPSEPGILGFANYAG